MEEYCKGEVNSHLFYFLAELNVWERESVCLENKPPAAKVKKKEPTRQAFKPKSMSTLRNLSRTLHVMHRMLQGLARGHVSTRQLHEIQGFPGEWWLPGTWIGFHQAVRSRVRPCHKSTKYPVCSFFLAGII